MGDYSDIYSIYSTDEFMSTNTRYFHSDEEFVEINPSSAKQINLIEFCF